MPRHCLALMMFCVLACSSKSPGSSAPSTKPSATKPPAETVATAPAKTTPPAAATPDAGVAVQASTPAASETCPLKPLPKGCPAQEPNVNRPCDKKGVECVYVAGCCPSPVYVCNKKGRFEARFQRC